MKVIFCFQDILDLVTIGVQELVKNPNEVKVATHKESKKRDCKALFLIHQGVDVVHFEKIAVATSANEAWDSLEKCYSGGEKLKKAKLQTLKRQYKLMQF